MKSFILRSWIFSARLQLETLIQRELRVGLKLHSPAWLAGGLGLLLSAVGATGQSTFQNLDFEMATLTPAPPWGVRQRISAANALPYWTVREDTTVFTTIWGAYDIDWTAVTLVCPDTYDPYGGLSYPSLQGVYSVQLSACTMNPDFKSSSISQTGLIPVGMNSIWFQMESPPFAGGVQASPVVTLNGSPINISPMSSSGGVITMAGDISAFAGTTVNLSFQCAAAIGGFPQNENIFALDAVQFSRTAVPEPGCFGLFALGALLLGHRVLRERYAVQPRQRK